MVCQNLIPSSYTIGSEPLFLLAFFHQNSSRKVEVTLHCPQTNPQSIQNVDYFAMAKTISGQMLSMNEKIEFRGGRVLNSGVKED